jgi:hypothetical protein
MIVVATAPFTHVRLLLFVVTGAGPAVRPMDRSSTDLDRLGG